MSAIDSYTYSCLGILECPIAYRFFGTAKDIRPLHIAIYRLEQDIPEFETDFQGVVGDILVGGGGGEAPAMRIMMPQAVLMLTNWERFLKEFKEIISVFSIYWSPNETYMMCSGFETLGWNPDKEQIGVWLTEHVVAFLIDHFADEYSEYIGQDELDHDGSICRTLRDEEDRIWNWKKYKDK